MSDELVVRLSTGGSISCRLRETGEQAASLFAGAAQISGIHLLLTGDRDYWVTLEPPVAPSVVEQLLESRASWVRVIFPERRPVRRWLQAVVVGAAAGEPVALTEPLDLMAGRWGATPLWLLPKGTISHDATREPVGLEAGEPLIRMARWVTARRTSTFEQLFPPSMFHPDVPLRPERLSASQAGNLLTQLRGALQAAAVGGDAARQDPQAAAQLRSAALTILSHLLATVLKDGSWRSLADTAALEIFRLIDAERDDPTARPALRAHAILLLQLRGPALSPADRQQATTLLRGLVRGAPPYAELTGPWRFSMCSAHSFHDGECEVLMKTHGFREVTTTVNDVPSPISWRHYRVFEAPFSTPQGQPIRIYARSADPRDENLEMGNAAFVGVLINRHAQLGAFDMQAAAVEVTQVGYKLMLNSQCAGLTTRFAIARLFPDADIYSSWDSTRFRTDGTPAAKVTASEGLDCFVALLEGMSEGESHAGLEERIRRVQWYHPQRAIPGFVQFVGPAHPLVVQRYTDLNQDGRADLYDGFFDFQLREIAEDLHGSATPRDPGVAETQIGGEAAQGLNWAAGSLNRVTQYAELWSGLPGLTEQLYPYVSGGFFSHAHPPLDVAVGQDAPPEELGRLPAVCRYTLSDGKLTGEVMFHSWLAHSAMEFKRLLCAAEAMWRAFDLGHLPRVGLLATPLGQRGAVLLALAGLLEFPAEQNHIDGLWSLALQLLNFPPISRSLVRKCISTADHDASYYYGSLRGLRQLVGASASDTGDLGRADPVAHDRLKSSDPTIGRAGPLKLE